MKNFVVLLSILLLSQTLFSNEVEEKKVDEKSSQEIVKTEDVKKVEPKSNFTHGGFGGMSMRGTRINDDYEMLVGMKGAYLLNRKYLIGIAGYGLKTENKINGKEAGLKYGGLLLGYIFYPESFITPKATLVIGGGTIGKKEDDNKKNKIDKDDKDKFFVIEPEVSIAFNFTKYFQASIDASYRFTHDAKWESYEDSELRDFNVGVSLNFGYF